MKKIVLLILTIFLFLPIQSNAADVAHPELNRINAKALKQLIDKKGEFILIDSRDSEKYNNGHIKGAVNIHFDPEGDPNVLNMSLMALPMDKLLIVYCDSKDEKISAGLALDLYNMGCSKDKLKILSGGISQWRKSGYPVTAGQ